MITVIAATIWCGIVAACFAFVRKLAFKIADDAMREDD